MRHVPRFGSPHGRIGVNTKRVPVAVPELVLDGFWLDRGEFGREQLERDASLV
jgi:hypothetical protein